MSVEVRRASAQERERWDGWVARSPHANPFHRRGALVALAEHADARLHPLVGFKGQEPAGLFPLFETRRAGLSLLFSPLPDLLVPYLGPALLNVGKLKRRKAERRHERFVEGCLDWLDSELDPRYVHVRTDSRYADLRPLKWNGFSVEPGYTYVVDLAVGAEKLLERFSSDARSNVRNTPDSAYTVEEGGPAAIDRIVGQVRRRYDAQGKSYGVTPAFVRDLHERLPEGVLRAHVCRVDGEFAGGIVTLEGEGTIYRWQGGAKHDADLPINDLLDWQIMRDAIDRGIEAYDLVGADARRLNRYKAKFGPGLRSYHQAERAGPAMRLAREIYTRLR
jgi:hypothetical protein